MGPFGPEARMMEWCDKVKCDGSILAMWVMVEGTTGRHAPARPPRTSGRGGAAMLPPDENHTHEPAPSWRCRRRHAVIWCVLLFSTPSTVLAA